MIEIVLFEPEIPPNTGNIGRLCHAAELRLHLIEPLGFSLDEKSLKRAGLDYWQDLDVHVWPDYDSWQESNNSRSNIYFITTKGDKIYWEIEYLQGDCLVFGPETRGLPESLLKKHADNCLRIPQKQGRSLNLATSVGVIAYEAIRQIYIA